MLDKDQTGDGDQAGSSLNCELGPRGELIAVIEKTGECAEGAADQKSKKPASLLGVVLGRQPGGIELGQRPGHEQKKSEHGQGKGGEDGQPASARHNTCVFAALVRAVHQAEPETDPYRNWRKDEAKNQGDKQN